MASKILSLQNELLLLKKGNKDLLDVC